MENRNATVPLVATYANGDLMEPWAYTVAAMVLFLIGFFGFFLNLIVIVLMCKDSQLWSPMNVILFNLVCCDFTVSVIGNPLTLTASLAHHWIFGHTACVAYGFFMALLGITSITTLTVLSYERYSLITYPFSSHQLSHRGATFSVVLIWIYSLALTMPPLFGWGAYVNEAANISCSVNWETHTNNATTYIVFLFIFGSLLPIIVITYSYVNIIVTMRRNSNRLGRVNRAEGRVTWMVLIMILAFLIAWTPYSAFALIEQFGDSNIITPGMAVLPSLIAKSSICYNPLIYVGMNTQFRQAVQRLHGKESIAVNTTINQMSSCSRQIECSGFDMSKKKSKNGSKQLKILLVDENNTANDCGKAVKKIQTHEMVVMSNGRESRLISTNSHQSSLCQL